MATLDFSGAAAMRVTLVDVLAFGAEVAVYVAVAAAAWQRLPPLLPAALGVVAAVTAMALWWGLLHSPKARVRLPRVLDRALRAAWFGLGLAAAVWAAAGQ